MVLVKSFIVVAAGLISSMALAQGDVTATSSRGLIALAVAIVMGVAAFGAASAQGKAAASALEGITRNPNSKSQVNGPMLLSLAFMEFQALLGFVVAFLLYQKL